MFVLRGVIFGFITGKPQARAANGEPLIIEQRTNLPDHQHILALIIPAISATLHGVELRKLLLPIAQHVWFYPTQLADFANGEVAFAWDRRELVVMTWFQHKPLLGPSTSALDEK